MKQPQPSNPSGVLYFSNGVEIEKLDLKTRKREVAIPRFDDKGEPTISVYPVYSSSANKIYFFRTSNWSLKCQLAIYDLANQRIEKTFDFCGDALSLSPDEQRLAYFRGGGLGTREEREKPSQLVLRHVLNGREEVIADDLSFFSEPAIWLSNREILYTNAENEITQINLDTKVRQKRGHKGVTLSSLSPDGAQVLGAERSLDFSKIYVLDVKERTLKQIKKIKHFTIGGTFIWTPDGKSFIYTRQNWTNLVPFEEVGHLYWHDLATGKEIRLADKVALFGGFWLPEDPTRFPEKA